VNRNIGVVGEAARLGAVPGGGRGVDSGGGTDAF
jgi:hypothetical protein